MALGAGSRLGPYEIVSPLGAGGMGEVYRARDTRLDRSVAIKILPQHLNPSPEAKQRFDREARAISGLQHPHICTLYDIGHQDGTDYLVMECLEGETLAERLRKGPLPQSELLTVGIQVASALDKAHRQGIVHRDLKPSNIMLTKAGAKLMDFGLAKAAGAAMATGSGSVPMFTAAVTAGSGSPMSPLTASGTIVGTIQYMSPEQVEGKEADARSDIFALGAVLYEMATGRRAFEGKSQISIASAILEKAPEPIAAVKPMSPPALDFVVRTCLAKDPDARFQTAHDVELQLKWIAEGGSQAGVPAPVTSHHRHREGVAWAAAAVLLVIASLLGVVYWRVSSTPQPVWKSYVLPPEKYSFGAGNLPGGHLALSPDGHKIAYVASTGSGQQLFLQSLDAASPEPLPETEDASYPFWSPDSRKLGFFAGGKLKRIDADGGPPQTICDAANARGGSWNEAGTIIFAPEPGGPLMAVAAAGGTPQPLTQLDKTRNELSHRWPWFLPDGRHYLFTARSGALEDSGIFLGTLGSSDRKLIVAANSNAIYMPAGYLLFEREGTLMTQRFDDKRLALEGEPSPVAENVAYNGNFSIGAFSASANGVLVYLRGAAASNDTQTVWYDRSGKVIGQPLVGANGPSLSPDGRTLALQQAEQANLVLWLLDLARNVKTRFSFAAPFSISPVWSPDGKEIVFGTTAPPHLYIKPADGSAPERSLFEGSPAVPFAWSHDGRYLLFRTTGSSGMPEAWALPMQGEKKPFPVVRVPSFHVNWADFSPDGKWVTYQSDESGKPQVYIAPFPGPGGRWQVSTDGGLQPLWRGNEVFFLNDGKVWAAEVQAKGAGVQLGTAHALFSAPFQGNPGHWYDVSRDGKRFVANVSTKQESNVPLNLVVNWTAGLKK